MGNHLYDALFAPHEGAETAFLHTAEGGTVSHGAFLTLAARIAHVLHDLGMRPGDRIVVQAEKSPEALAIYAACIRAGVIFLPLNTAYTAAEVRYFLSDSGARVMICDSRALPALSAVAGEGVRLLTLDGDGTGSLADLAAGAAAAPVAAPVPRAAGDLAALLYTSGTTGRSKGAMLSHDNLLSNARVLCDHWRFVRDDVLLHALPIFHTHGLFVATNIALLAGCPMIFLPRFDLDQVIAHLPAATAMMGVPTFYTRLLDDPRLDRERVARARLFISGSAPLLEETHRAWEARTGHRILERYGMTETNMTTSNPYAGERRAGTVGLPLPGVEAKVCDDAGQDVPQGEIGTLEVRGPNVFRGYWGMPEKTAAELRADGFFITGDLARQDADGYITIVGRGKDLIIAGGFNIYPKEVEQAIDALPGVRESAVIGAPHPDLGEGVVAVIVPDIVAGRDTPPDPEAIRAALSDRLARFKQPRHIAFRHELPRNTMGKVQKAALRDEYADVFKV